MSADAAPPPQAAPPFPPPDPMVYQIIDVDTAQELADAAWNLQSNQAIVIAPGSYDLAAVSFPNGVDGRITVGRFGAPVISNIQIRGATDNPADVVLRGAGMLNPIVPYGVQIFTARDVLLANFSVGEVYYHAIGVQGGQGAGDIRIYNVRAFDAGQQIIKGSGAGADDVSIEYSQVDYTVGAVVHPEGSPPNTCYTNGIDVTGGDRWIIRDTRIERIRCQNNAMAGPAILIWQGSADTLIERNLILDSSRGISMGLVASSDHSGGIVRNNLIRWNPSATYTVDVPIYTTSPNAKILHNTALTRGRYANGIEVRFSGATGVEVANNLLDAAVLPRQGATPIQSGNRSDAELGWFRDEANGDLRLSTSGESALTALPRRIDVLDDCLSEARPIMTEPGACGRDLRRVFADGFEL
ncbi:right-handed parallel beta-helix repeat-containing protein [Pseudomarimonas arenosa]|uniref:Right-handed parallel beta-helix repeat-containing protein n=1 Tax=Pseudomarimonas arenosa TaxID=2774145 RepID=A0AAW3ZSY1_9GAMM|nr:right-handed parallel beta-helix repeat-containing protein [Pseudomarimonas arenosa]MBD8527624.1 right-handed parallel beta-helix repeat-containing protein [Pseudomarimonas arenosa]